MNRKNTILLAVFMNAALLIVLFTMALTTQEEISLAPTHELSQSSVPAPEAPSPMFGDELDFLLRSGSSVAEAPLPHVQPAETFAIKPETPTIVHSLPPVQQAAATHETPVAPPMKATNAVAAVGADEVRVKTGDTLEKIAKAHRTTVDEIIQLNHLPSSFLRIGQVLKLPAEKVSAAKPAKPAAVEKALPSNTPDYYTVKVGDNPWMIAMKHHLKVEELLKLNGLNEEKARKLKPGDRLRIK